MGNQKKEDIQKKFEIPKMTRNFTIPQQREIPKMPPVAPPKKEKKSDT
jgi:hypothetical protein